MPKTMIDHTYVVAYIFYLFNIGIIHEKNNVNLCYHVTSHVTYLLQFQLGLLNIVHGQLYPFGMYKSGL